MELYRNIIKSILMKNPEVVLVDVEKVRDILESECYVALESIRHILRDDTLIDKECFEKIEKIVSVYETLGSGCGTRHDFG